MKYCDLNIHSNISDGVLTPEEIVELAIRKGLAAISITDHDAVDGIDPGFAAIKGRPLELVPGIEFSSRFEGSEKIEEIHVLAYYLDYKAKILRELLDDIVDSRVHRAAQMVKNLREAGVDIPLSEVQSASGNEIIGRPHVADVMVAHGYVASRTEAFRNYLTKGKPGYSERYKPKFDEIVSLIKKLGGVPILAHPGIVENQRDIGILIDQGVMGLEVYHSKHSQSDNHKFLQIAAARKILITGGSDCHGPAGGFPPMLGNVTIEYKYLEQLKAAAKKMEGI